MTEEENIIIDISPDDFFNMQFGFVDQLLKSFMVDNDTISSKAGKLIFNIVQIEDYTEEPAGLHEAREWFAKIDKKYPFLPFFLDRTLKSGQIQLYTSMLVPFNYEGDNLKFDRQKLESFAVDKIQVVNEFCITHDIDPKEAIKRFCELLNLDIIEEMVESENQYPFRPEKITSRFLTDFFSHGFYFHTIDASDEPVLFSLVDEPIPAYYAKVTLDIELFNSPYYPIIVMDLTVFDRADNPLKMSFVYNVGVERHRKELQLYTEMNYLTCNFLYRAEADELFFGFTKAVDLSPESRKKIRGYILDASNMLRAIPKEARNFSAGAEEMLMVKTGNEPVEAGQPVIKSDSNKSSKNKSNTYQSELPLSKEPDILDEYEIEQSTTEQSTTEQSTTEQSTTEQSTIEQSTLEAPEVKPQEFGQSKVTSSSDQRTIVPVKSSDRIPNSILPESIQKITRALSRPVRRPAKSITAELAITPAPKKVILRDEDQLERTSRRLLIMQNNLERVERENIRLANELRLAVEEIERLHQTNLELESRWWKFWK